MNSVPGEILVLSTQLTDEILKHKPTHSILNPYLHHIKKINILCIFKFSDCRCLQVTETVENNTIDTGTNRV